MTSPSAAALRWGSLWAPPLGWMTVIFLISNGPAPPILPQWSWFDKAVHALVYALLSGLLWRAGAATWRQAPSRMVSLGAVLATSLYGVSDEIHQSLVPNRFPDVADWAADTLGAVLAAWLLSSLRARRRQRQVRA